MTRLTFLLGAALLTQTSGALYAQTTPAASPGVWTNRSRVLPDKLHRVPDGLTIWDTPNPSYPEPNPDSPGGYVWKHDTKMRAEVGDLEVVEVGSFIWFNESGWMANRLMKPEDAAKAFNCPNALLRKGRTYTFGKNWRYAANAGQLYGGDALWYVLAKDKAGKLYKGITLVETESKVEDTEAAAKR